LAKVVSPMSGRGLRTPDVTYTTSGAVQAERARWMARRTLAGFVGMGEGRARVVLHDLPS